MKLTETAKQNYEKWLACEKLDPPTRAELESIRGNEEEILGRFSASLSFGTAGLRGVMAAGTARLNRYTVAQATQGLAQLIKKKRASARGVAIAYDSRNHSREYAEVAARVLAGNRIKVYLFDDLRPTPELSFALRYLSCIAGVNITASHNSKEYNGYKAYWEDGAQLPPDHAAAVSAEIAKIDIFEGVKLANYKRALASDRIELIGRKIDRAYLKNVLAERVCPPGIDRAAKDLKIVYSPLHGAGWKLVPRVFREMGIGGVYIVPEQAKPDGNFPSVKKPNPELAEVFTPGIALAEKVGADLIVATDPDSDRVGVMSRGKDGKFARISGNAMGALLLDYLLTAMKETGGIPADAYAVKTIVSTELFSEIARKNGVKVYNVLTGFKFIGEVIKQHEALGRGTYVLGFEESYGYLKGTYARDKDAVCASMLIAEMAAFYRQKKMTLLDALEDLYARYGYYAEYTENLEFSGADAARKMAAVTASLRRDPPKEIAGSRVVSIGDYLAGTLTDLKTGKAEATGLPSSDVLRYETENGDVILVRPSGTEPKVKVYLLVSAKTKPALDKKLAACKAAIPSLVRA